MDTADMYEEAAKKVKEDLRFKKNGSFTMSIKGKNESKNYSAHTAGQISPIQAALFDKILHLESTDLVLVENYIDRILENKQSNICQKRYQ